MSDGHSTRPSSRPSSNARSPSSLLPKVTVLETLRFRLSPPMLAPSSTRPGSNRWGAAPENRWEEAAPESPLSQAESATSTQRELPDVTGFLVLVLVTVGLFIVPV